MAANPHPTYDPETVVVGTMGRPHGLRGEVLLRPYNTRGSAVGDATSLILERDGVRRTIQVERLRPGGENFIAKLAGVDDRDAAAALTLSLVRLPRSALPPLAPGEFYVEDVVGCEVFAAGGERLGVAEATFWNGAHDVVVVVDGDSEVMIPLVPEFVQAVDAEGRRVVVEWEGDEDGDEDEDGKSGG